MKTRTEKDSLGKREVPFAAYYGIQTQRAIENYPISGFCAHVQLIRAIGMIKKAAALANADLKLIDARRARAIACAAEEVIAGKWNDQFVVDVYQAGAGVSFHMNANEVIANRAIEILGGKRGEYQLCHPNDHVNFGQSTNDAVFPTAMRLAALIFIPDQRYRIALGGLEQSFARQGEIIRPHPKVRADALDGCSSNTIGSGIRGIRHGHAPVRTIVEASSGTAL